MGQIQKIVNDINNKVYIGKTERSIEERFKEHCLDKDKRRSEKRPLYSAMNKYGIEHFHIELVEEVEENLEEREIYWINYYNSYHNGYNATLGGEGKSLQDYNLILEELKNNPYPREVAQKIGCHVDTVLSVAKLNNIKVKSKGWLQVNPPRPVMQFTKTGEYIKTFPSCKEAVEECILLKTCTGQNSGGARGHISECAAGKRKTAYGFIWKQVQE